jgi:predicted O-linked N-acetylglucosamine transferase (SPINDLY family)
MTTLTPLQQGIKLLTEGNLVAAQEVLQDIRSRGEADAASAARFLAHIEKSERRYGKAITTLLTALDDLGPDSATLAQLAELYMAVGKHEDAIAAAEDSLERESDNSITSLNLAIWRSNRSDDPMAIRQDFEAWTERFLERAVCETALQSPEAARLASEQKLRVGYVSGDLGNHPVRYLIEPYFRLHDHTRFDIHAFMCSDEDEISLLLKDHVPHWHNVKDLNDDALLERIRALRIDILVDLSGHTEASRMSVFAARAAPVQVTWWGFVHTLGLREIDYRLTDWQTAPEGADEYYTEALCRLHCHTAYLPPVNTEKQYPPPWSKNGYVTMISLNHSRKISDAALDSLVRNSASQPGEWLDGRHHGNLRCGHRGAFSAPVKRQRLPHGPRCRDPQTHHAAIHERRRCGRFRTRLISGLRRCHHTTCAVDGPSGVSVATAINHYNANLQRQYPGDSRARRMRRQHTR